MRYCTGWLRWGRCAHKALRDLAPEFPPGMALRNAKSALTSRARAAWEVAHYCR